MNDDLRGAFKQAAESWRDMTASPADHDIKTYERMTPQHFEALYAKYGLEEVANYVREMEFRRLKRDRGG